MLNQKLSFSPTRLCCGFLLDVQAVRMRRVYLFGGCILASGFCMTLLPRASDVLGVGLTYGLYTVTSTLLYTEETAALLADLGRPTTLYSGLGLLRCFRALAVLAGPLVAGRDNTFNFHSRRTFIYMICAKQTCAYSCRLLYNHVNIATVGRPKSKQCRIILLTL